LREGMRKGPVIAGSIVFSIPYMFGIAGAAGGDFENGSAWLALPVGGPLLMLATRKKTECSVNALDCTADSGLKTLLILDFFMQTTGAVFLIWGLSSPKKELVRNDFALKLTPTPVGSGYGFGAVGTF
jgi:hypothetical protein